MPGAKVSQIESVLGGIRFRAATKVDQSDLEEAGGRHPVIGLKAMEMKSLDDTGVIEGGGNLGRGGGKPRD